MRTKIQLPSSKRQVRSRLLQLPLLLKISSPSPLPRDSTTFTSSKQTPLSTSNQTLACLVQSSLTVNSCTAMMLKRSPDLLMKSITSQRLETSGTLWLVQFMANQCPVKPMKNRLESFNSSTRRMKKLSMRAIARSLTKLLSSLVCAFKTRPMLPKPLVSLWSLTLSWNVSQTSWVRTMLRVRKHQPLIFWPTWARPWEKSEIKPLRWFNSAVSMSFNLTMLYQA